MKGKSQKNSKDSAKKGRESTKLFKEKSNKKPLKKHQEMKIPLDLKKFSSKSRTSKVAENLKERYMASSNKGSNFTNITIKEPTFTIPLEEKIIESQNHLEHLEKLAQNEISAKPSASTKSSLNSTSVNRFASLDFDSDEEQVFNIRPPIFSIAAIN